MKRRTIAMAATAVTALVALVTLEIATDTPYRRFRATVISQPQLLQGSRVINQTQENIGVDEKDTLHLRLPARRAKQIVSTATIRDCSKRSAHCSRPSWVTLQELQKYNLTAPEIDGSTDDANILCAARWNDTKDDRLITCVDIVTDELWYDLDIT
jgi:hypothetical protein